MSSAVGIPRLQAGEDANAAIVRDYLRPDAQGLHGRWPTKQRQRQLMDYATEGKWGLGAEKVSNLRDHLLPCEDLWKCKKK